MTTIRFERDGAIGNIVLANPPFNRLDKGFAEALRVAVHQASESDIRVLAVRSEGPHFSFGGEVREWPGKDINWFRTFVADINVAYRDRKCNPSVRRSYDSDAADCRSFAADRGTRRSGSCVAIRHAW